MPEALEAATFVYAIWDGCAVKIGKSKGHPQRRLDALQTGNPRTLRLLAYTVELTESDVHRKLRRHRIRGEWFRPSIEVCREVNTWTWITPALGDLMARVFPVTSVITQ